MTASTIEPGQVRAKQQVEAGAQLPAGNARCWRRDMQQPFTSDIGSLPHDVVPYDSDCFLLEGINDDSLVVKGGLTSASTLWI